MGRVNARVTDKRKSNDRRNEEEVWDRRTAHIWLSEHLLTWLASHHSMETSCYALFWLCSPAKYGWMKNYLEVKEDSMTGRAFPTLLRSSLPAWMDLCMNLYLWNMHLMLHLDQVSWVTFLHKGVMKLHLLYKPGNRRVFCWYEMASI